MHVQQDDALLRRGLNRIAGLGTAAQASIPGFYAWAVTVAPAAWARGTAWPVRALALVGPLALGGAAILERRSAGLSRIVSVWGLIGSSILVWLLVPAALTPARMDALRAVAGSLGWALFAFASAAPPVGPHPPQLHVRKEGPLQPRGSVPRGDLWYVAAGVTLAGALQAFGWGVASLERALLSRLVALAAGLSVIGCATSITLARHARRTPARHRVRVRRALLWVVLLFLLGIGGAFMRLR